MHTEPHTEGHHHRRHNTAQRFEGLIQALMVIAVAILAIGLIYGVLNTGSGTPAWMR
jgi:hypothetical protein